MKTVRPLVAALAVALLALAAVEGALRLAGFSREIAPVTLRFGYPNPREIVDLFRFDPRLFWRLRPGGVFDAEAPVPINRLGYRGPTAAVPRPPGLLRIAVMGDSVAFGGGEAWPEILQERLAARIAPRPVEVLNYGVPGYTVVQGWRQFEDDVAPLGPDIVLIAYGWNDHWLAHGGTPDDARLVPPRWRAELALRLSRLRIAQAVRMLIPASDDPPAAVGSTVRRVPGASFAAYVERLARAAREAGAAAVVVGLPSALTEDAFPAYLVDMGFTPSAREAVADHAAYLAWARAAAERAGAAFVDAGPAFSRAGTADASLFTQDRIHLAGAGHHAMAELLAPIVLERIAR